MVFNYQVALIKKYINQIYFDKRYCQAIYDMNGKQVAFAATIEIS
jgi:hypothetical protein